MSSSSPRTPRSADAFDEEVYQHGLRALEKNDDAKAVEFLLEAAERGHAGAQCALGNCFEEGRGLALDDQVSSEKVFPAHTA